MLPAWRHHLRAQGPGFAVGLLVMRMSFNPEPDTIIGGGDKLVVLGRPDSLKRLETEAAGHG